MAQGLAQEIARIEKKVAAYRQALAQDGLITKDETAVLKSLAAKLDRLRAATAKSVPDTFPVHAAALASGKLEPGVQSVLPDPKLEKDPAVLRYRWSAREQRYQVTKYDPELVKLGANGRPMTGAIVKLDGHDIRLDDAIGVIRGWAGAKVGAVKRIEDTPFGTRALLSKSHCAPVYTLLKKCVGHCDQAAALLKADKPEEAKKQLAAATQAYNQAALKLNSAKRNIENNVELTVGILSAIKAAGEVAEIVLVVTGAGAAAKGVGAWAKAKNASSWVVKAAELATAAGVKTAYAAADQVRDSLVFKPDEPIDWGKVGWDSAKSFVFNMISDSISEALAQGLKTMGGYKDVADLPAVKQFFAQLSGNLAASLLSATADAAQDATKKKEKKTPRQLVARAAKKNESQAAKIFAGAAQTIATDLLSSISDPGFVQAFTKQYPSVLAGIQKALVK